MSDCCKSYALQIEQEYAVIVDPEPDILLVTEGEQGPPGPPGPPGAGGGADLTFYSLRGETLSALTVVYELNGRVYALDPSDSDHIDLLLGITLNGGPAGTDVEIKNLGVMDDTNWSWILGRIWLGPGGRLTQAPPADGFDVLIGTALSATRVSLNIQDSIELE